MARPIFLIGFMCSGKSRVGRELAEQLGLRHVDIDRVVEERVGPLVPYFQQHGEAAFREREREVLLELLAERDVVVSTGGGTPLECDNMERMLAAGPVVFLEVPMATLMPRIIRAGGDRPLLLGLNGEPLRTRVESLLAARLPVYASASHTVDADGTAEEAAFRIRKALG
jgi:shikimate kinase